MGAVALAPLASVQLFEPKDSEAPPLRAAFSIFKNRLSSPHKVLCTCFPLCTLPFYRSAQICASKTLRVFVCLASARFICHASRSGARECCPFLPFPFNRLLCPCTPTYILHSCYFYSSSCSFIAIGQADRRAINFQQKGSNNYRWVGRGRADGQMHCACDCVVSAIY